MTKVETKTLMIDRKEPDGTTSNVGVVSVTGASVLVTPEYLVLRDEHHHYMASMRWEPAYHVREI